MRRRRRIVHGGRPTVWPRYHCYDEQSYDELEKERRAKKQEQKDEEYLGIDLYNTYRHMMRGQYLTYLPYLPYLPDPPPDTAYTCIQTRRSSKKQLSTDTKICQPWDMLLHTKM